MEKVLVCLLASTRSHHLTFPNIKRQVIDELNADVALALAIDEHYDYANPFWQHAKYRWTSPDFKDYGEAFDLAQRWLCQQKNLPASDWRPILRIKGIWQGGIKSPDPQRTASSIQTFCRWLLLKGLQEDGLLDRYDRFVITRSDLVWLCPHPPLSILDRDAIWVPDGENYGGLVDRHLVVSRTDLADCLNVIEDIVLHPTQLYEEMRNLADRPPDDSYHLWNNELFFAQHLKRKNLFHKVRRFPYVMYTARQVNDESSTWSRGRYEPAVGHYVKYEAEYRAASAYATIIRNRADWEAGAWTQISHTPTVPSRVSLLSRFYRSCLIFYFWIRSAIRRPGRAGRMIQFLKRSFSVSRQSE